jgi:hypothetical protein
MQINMLENMKLELNVTGLIIVIALLVGTFFFGRYLGRKVEENALSNLSEQLEDNIQTKDSYKIRVDSLTEYVNQVNNSITHSTNVIKQLEGENARLKALRLDDAQVYSYLRNKRRGIKQRA